MCLGTSKPKKVTLTNKNSPAAYLRRDRDRAVHDCRRPQHLLGRDHRAEKSCSFEVEFAPTKVGDASGGIEVTYDGTSPSVNLEGNGVAAR